jgi:hypothetical protein
MSNDSSQRANRPEQSKKWSQVFIMKNVNCQSTLEMMSQHFSFNCWVELRELDWKAGTENLFLLFALAWIIEFNSLSLPWSQDGNDNGQLNFIKLKLNDWTFIIKGQTTCLYLNYWK